MKLRIMRVRLVPEWTEGTGHRGRAEWTDEANRSGRAECVDRASHRDRSDRMRHEDGQARTDQVESDARSCYRDRTDQAECGERSDQIDRGERKEYVRCDGLYDLLIEDGIVTEIVEHGARIDGGAGFVLGTGGEDAAAVFDGAGCLAAPGFIDLHVHFRDPGYTAKEDIPSGSRAAAGGGFTTVCCMPNTNPAIDCPATLRQVDESGRKTDLVNLFVVPAMTIGQKGQRLTDLRAMDQEATLCRALTGHGVAGVTEDGKSLMDEALMRRVMETAKVLDLPVMDHAEDSGLTGGCIHEGAVSARLGLKGLPAEAEVRIVRRDIRLARETGARIHLQHISAAESVAAIREAKRDLPGLTAETAPHYFTLTEDVVSSLGADAKMNPPLRTKKDREAIREGLADGTLDIIATDHAPHTPAEKNAALDVAPFGIVGLETAFSISYTELVRGGVLSLPRLITLMSTRPASIIGLDRGRIAVGKTADLVLLDTEVCGRIDRETFLSKGRNTPFHGREVSGRVLLTIRNGRVTFAHPSGAGPDRRG